MATVVKRNGFFNRFFSSFGAILTGFLLIIGCSIGLGWNEWRSVKMIRSLDEVEKNVIDVVSTTVDPLNEGKLVGLSGSISFTTPAADSIYGFTSDSVALIRKVEVMQWRETKSGSSTDEEETYTYSKEWSSTIIDSSRFYDTSYTNPSWPVGEAFTQSANYSPDSKVGAFDLLASQLADLPTSAVASLPSEIIMPNNTFNVSDRYITNSLTPAMPLVGDIRISFERVTVSDVSLIGRQQGSNIVDYKTSNGNVINRIFTGIKTAQQMVETLRSENSIITWVLRIILTILVCMGFAMLLTPAQVLLSVVPFIGRYLSRFSKAVAGLIGFVLGLSLSLVIIAVSWIAVRPIIAIPLLACVVGLIALIVIMSKNKKATSQAPQQP